MILSSTSSPSSITSPDVKHVLVPIADGTEEVEATTIITVLRRGGVKVLTPSLHHTSPPPLVPLPSLP